jgi:hypothetical protein
MEQPLAVNAENSRAKVQNVGGDSSAPLQEQGRFWMKHGQKGMQIFFADYISLHGFISRQKAKRRQADRF